MQGIRIRPDEGMRIIKFIHEATGLTIQDLGLTPYTGPYRTMSFKDHVEATLVG